MAVGPVQRDEATAPFLDAARAGTFLLRRCAHCDGWAGPQEQRCPHCGAADLRWEPASGRARVVSWSVATGAAGPDGVRAQTVVVIAELAEGPWWWTQLVGADIGQLHIGDPLVAAFEAAEGSETVPVFAPA